MKVRSKAASSRATDVTTEEGAGSRKVLLNSVPQDLGTVACVCSALWRSDSLVARVVASADILDRKFVVLWWAGCANQTGHHISRRGRWQPVASARSPKEPLSRREL